MANKSTKRGAGKPDMNVRAFETVQMATGQMAKPEAPKSKRIAVGLGQAAKKSTR
jgi:hypothetical protein